MTGTDIVGTLLVLLMLSPFIFIGVAVVLSALPSAARSVRQAWDILRGRAS